MLPARPDWVRRINAMAAGVGGADAMVSFDADELIDAARAATGLQDFGDPGWEEPYRRLVSALDGEARLHVVGRLLSRHDLLRHLGTRLLLVDAAQRDPGVASEEVVAPVVVTGAARTGTSILHELAAHLPEECLWLMAPDFDIGFWAMGEETWTGVDRLRRCGGCGRVWIFGVGCVVFDVRC